MKGKKGKGNLDELVSGVIALAVLFLLVTSIPELKAYFDQLFVTVLSAIFIGLILVILMVGVWFVFFRGK